MRLSDFNFELPQELIAQYPAEHRDECKLMVVDRAKKEISHTIFKDIISYFEEGDLFVFNDTKIFPAHLMGVKESTGVKIDVLLLRELSMEHRLWDTLVNPARKIRIGNKIYFGEDQSLVAEVVDNTTSRGRTLRFLYEGKHDNFKEELYNLGKTPLPDYITRPTEKEDAERYQTIFAKEEGAVICPSAGLHFSRELMKRMEIQGIDMSFLTLHISLCSDRDIDVEDLFKYKPESEQLTIPKDLVEKIERVRQQERKVCAIGTSVSKSLEAVSKIDRRIKEFSGWESKFIFPPYHFDIVDALVTNFHLPYSMYFMHACAFGGFELMQRAYDEAIKEGYQFGDYGDAMLII